MRVHTSLKKLGIIMKITPLFNCNQLEFDQAKSRDIIFLKCKSYKIGGVYQIRTDE